MRLVIALFLFAHLIGSLYATEPAFVYVTNILLLNSAAPQFDEVYEIAFTSALAKSLKMAGEDIKVLDFKQQASTSLVSSNDIVASVEINLPLNTVPDEYDSNMAFLREYLRTRLYTIIDGGICTTNLRSELSKREVTDNAITVAAFNVAYPDDDVDENNSNSLSATSAGSGDLNELIVILCVILGFIAFATFTACSCRLYYMYKRDPSENKTTIHGLEENRIPDLQFEYVVDESVINDKRGSEKSFNNAINKMNALHNANGTSNALANPMQAPTQDQDDADLQIDLGLEFGVGEVESNAGSARSSLSNSRGSRNSFSRPGSRGSIGSAELGQLRELGASQDLAGDLEDIGHYSPPKPRKVEDRSRAKNVKKKFETMIASNIDESTGEQKAPPNPFSRANAPPEEKSIEINWV